METVTTYDLQSQEGIRALLGSGAKEAETMFQAALERNMPLSNRWTADDGKTWQVRTEERDVGLGASAPLISHFEAVVSDMNEPRLEISCLYAIDCALPLDAGTVWNWQITEIRQRP